MNSGVTTTCERCDKTVPIEGCGRTADGFYSCPITRRWMNTTDMMGTDPATAAEWDALKAENAALRGALAPLADAADYCDFAGIDDTVFLWRPLSRPERSKRIAITAQDARNARAALKHGEDEPPPPPPTRADEQISNRSAGRT